MKIKEALFKLNGFCNANRIGESHAKHHLIGVQLVVLALKDKMKLRRDKDKTYMLNLIANLASL